MAWTTDFKTEQAKMDTHNFLQQGGRELYVVMGTWEQGLRVRVHMDMQTKDLELQLARAGRGQGPGRQMYTAAVWSQLGIVAIASLSLLST